MNKFTNSSEFRIISNFFFYKILNCFKIMISTAFDIFDASGIFFIKIFNNII